MSDHYESRKQRCKCYVLFTWGDFANIWSSTVIILHINTTRLCCTIRPCCMSSVLSHRMQGIFGGNIWDSVAQDSVQLLLQQHECMLKVCQLQGMQINLIGSTLTPHSGGWREGSTELAKLVFKLKHAQCNKSLFLVVRWLTRRQGDKERAVESVHLRSCEAFNVVSHSVLIIRLVQCGLDKRTTKWVENWLCCCWTQRGLTSSAKSNWQPALVGP